LEELEKFSHIWVLFIFHDNTDSARKVIDSVGDDEDDDGIPTSTKKKKKQPQLNSTFAAKVTPPRLGRKVGVFSTR
jgi:tRNA (Thr-GGU) A37 N-methylase